MGNSATPRDSTDSNYDDLVYDGRTLVQQYDVRALVQHCTSVVNEEQLQLLLSYWLRKNNKKIFIYNSTILQSLNPIFFAYLQTQIPAILEYLKQKVRETSKDYKSPGIFRLSGSTIKVNAAIDALFTCPQSTVAELNEKLIQMEHKSKIQLTCDDFAALIKRFYRDFNMNLQKEQKSQSLLKSNAGVHGFLLEFDIHMDSKQLKEMQFNEELCLQYLNDVVLNVNERPLEYSLFWWLMEMAAEVSLKSGDNKMNVKNLAIVFSSNLFVLDDIMQSLTYGAVFSKIIEVCIASKIADI